MINWKSAGKRLSDIFRALNEFIFPGVKNARLKREELDRQNRADRERIDHWQQQHLGIHCGGEDWSVLPRHW